MTSLEELLHRLAAFDEQVIASLRDGWQDLAMPGRAAWVACGVVIAALAVV